MITETARALVEKYRGTEEYADGYSDGLNCRPHSWGGEAYEIGHRAGTRAAKLFAAHGMTRTASGAFRRRVRS